MRFTKVLKTILVIILIADIITLGAVGSYYLYKSKHGDIIIIPPEEQDLTPKPFDPVEAKKILHYKNPNPVMQAIIDNRPLSEIAALLDSGIDVNAEDDAKNTALNYAIFCENKPVIKLLLNKGGKEGYEAYIFDKSPVEPIWYHFKNYSVPRLMLNPENYDDNGIITTQAIINQSTKDPTPYAILHTSYLILLVSSILLFRAGADPIPRRNFSKHSFNENLLLHFTDNFTVFSGIIIAYFIYIFTLPYPFQYLLTSLPHDAEYTGYGLLIIIGIKVFSFLYTASCSD